MPEYYVGAGVKRTEDQVRRHAPQFPSRDLALSDLEAPATVFHTVIDIIDPPISETDG